jgi:hypothetical protein
VSAVPVEPLEHFRESVAEAVAGGWRLASLFGMPSGNATAGAWAADAAKATGARSAR